MIEGILKPFIAPVKRMVIMPLKRAKSLPKLLIRWLVKWMRSIMGGKLRSLDNYWKIGTFYIAKKLFVIILILSLVIVYFGFIKPPKFVDKWFARTPKIEASAAMANGFTGQAKILDETGNLVYQGPLENGQYSGAGKLFAPDGTLLYIGDFSQGLKSGKGELYDEKGLLLYRGEFAADLYAGKGTLFKPDGTVLYDGSFAGGKYEGDGTLYLTEGVPQYTGAFVAGGYQGAGKLYDNTGKIVYEGEFNGGKYEGPGKLYRGDGTLQFEGQFLGGALSGEGIEYFPSGVAKYKGAFLLGNYHGAGSLMNEQGVALYAGNFVGGKRDGDGQAFNAEGIALYSGKFKADKYEGVGSLLDADGGTIYKGYFRGGDIYLQGFLAITLPKLQELLGAPDAPAAEEEIVLPEEDGGTDPTETVPEEAVTGGETGDNGSGTESGSEQPTDAGAGSPAEEAAGTESAAEDAKSGEPAAGTGESEAAGSSDGTESVTTPPEAASPSPETAEAQKSATKKFKVLPPLPDTTELPLEEIIPPPLPLDFTYSAHQLSFKLKADEDNPEAYAVTEINTWNKAVLLQLANAIKTSKIKGIKETLAGDKYEMAYSWNDALYIFTYNKDVPVRLSVSALAKS